MGITFEELYNDIEVAKNGIVVGPVSTARNAIAAVYVLYLVEDDSYYIGSTKNVGLRFISHKSKLSRKNHHSKKFQVAFDRCVNKTIKLTYVEVKSSKTLERLEQKLFDRYLSRIRSLNESIDSASPMGGRQHSTETKELLRQRNHEQFSCPDVRKRHSDISKERQKDPDLLSRMRAAQKEGREKYRAANDLSKRQKELWDRPGAKERHLAAMKDRLIPVMIRGKRYASINDAAKTEGISNVGLIYRLRSPKFTDYRYVGGDNPELDSEFKSRLEQILNTNLDTARNKKTTLTRFDHSFPAVFIIHFEGADKFYISSSGNLFERIRVLTSEIRNTKTKNPRKPKLTKVLMTNENRNMSVSWIRCDNPSQREIIRTQLIDKHISGGRLVNDSMS